jgi:hypothetical protein
MLLWISLGISDEVTWSTKTIGILLFVDRLKTIATFGTESSILIEVNQSCKGVDFGDRTRDLRQYKDEEAKGNCL